MEVSAVIMSSTLSMFCSAFWRFILSSLRRGARSSFSHSIFSFSDLMEDESEGKRMLKAIDGIWKVMQDCFRKDLLVLFLLQRLTLKMGSLYCRERKKMWRSEKCSVWLATPVVNCTTTTSTSGDTEVLRLRKEEITAVKGPFSREGDIS